MAVTESREQRFLRALDASLGRGRSRRLELGRGDRLFHRDEPVRSLFVLVEGRVRLERSLEDGSWVSIHVATAPAVIAEASLFAESYHCDAVAEVASTVRVLSRDDVDRALAADAQLCRLLLRQLATEVRDLRSRLELRSVRPVERRVLLSIELDGGIQRTVASRAAELGLAPETVSRALTKLEREGRIERHGRTIQLKS